jgi:putative FmdB family regulatory protein
MPTYDYRCSDCNYTFEYFQPMRDEPLTVCPGCGGNLKRIIGTGAGAIFKGSGFYQTDYKNKTSNKIKSSGSEHNHASTEKNAGSNGQDKN